MANDKDVIEAHGGSAKLARLLDCSVQRVENWKKRGIPPRVILDHPELFPQPKAPKRPRSQVTPP